MATHDLEAMMQPDGVPLAEAFKKRLRELGIENYVHDYGGMGSTQTGWMSAVEVDWESLDKEIDNFCAEWVAKEP
jgi:hypothetical protein